MKTQEIVIVGSSGHSKVIIDIFEKTPNIFILGLLDKFRKKGEKTLGYEILGSEDILKDLLEENSSLKVFIAIGDNFIRNKVFNEIIKIVPNIEFISGIHPKSVIGKGVKIGKGTCVMAGAVINSDTKVGDFCIINTNSSLDHDCIMEDYTSLAPNSVTGGNVKIGKFSSISISTTVKHGITIGKHSIIGAGSVLLNNCGDNIILYGIPAKEIRKRKIGERYL